MFAHVSLETERVRSVVAVPREAVQHDGSGDYAMAVGDDGKAEKRQVIVGQSDAGFISIRQGLSAGETVVTMSAFPVRDGQPVRVGGRREGVKPK
jgi:membrane fusion protein (multidrug efflux system)